MGQLTGSRRQRGPAGIVYSSGAAHIPASPEATAFARAFPPQISATACGSCAAPDRRKWQAGTEDPASAAGVYRARVTPDRRAVAGALRRIALARPATASDAAAIARCLGVGAPRNAPSTSRQAEYPAASRSTGSRSSRSGLIALGPLYPPDGRQMAVQETFGRYHPHYLLVGEGR